MAGIRDATALSRRRQAVANQSPLACRNGRAGRERRQDGHGRGAVVAVACAALAAATAAQRGADGRDGLQHPPDRVAAAALGRAAGGGSRDFGSSGEGTGNTGLHGCRLRRRRMLLLPRQVQCASAPVGLARDRRMRRRCSGRGRPWRGGTGCGRVGQSGRAAAARPGRLDSQPWTEVHDVHVDPPPSRRLTGDCRGSCAPDARMPARPACARRPRLPVAEDRGFLAGAGAGPALLADQPGRLLLRPASRALATRDQRHFSPRSGAPPPAINIGACAPPGAHQTGRHDHLREPCSGVAQAPHGAAGDYRSATTSR